MQYPLCRLKTIEISTESAATIKRRQGRPSTPVPGVVYIDMYYVTAVKTAPGTKLFINVLAVF